MCYITFVIGQTGSIVVCISRLVAVMKEQAAKFSAIGVSAEFVGEGQVDRTVKSRVLR